MSILVKLLLVIHLLSFKNAMGISPECPRHWKSFGDSCYLKGYGAMTWAETNYHCKHYGGQLATIENDKVNKFLLVEYLKTDNRSHWIGFQRCGGNKWCFPDWSIAGHYVNWYKGEPKNAGGNEGCAFIGNNGYWYDSPCRDKFPYLCQRKKGNVGTTNQKTSLQQLDKISQKLENYSRESHVTLNNIEKKLEKLLRISIIKLGSYRNPGKSCLDILQTAETKSLSDGEYWIITEYNKPMKVFCDMTTDGGGWTLVSNIVLQDSSGFSWSLSTDFRDISDYKSKKLGLSAYTLKALSMKMPFTQLRFYCHKKIPGRTFHIVTQKNMMGRNVVLFFTAQTNSFPKACGSFYRLSDDTSILARECSNWGRESGKYNVGKWWHDSIPVKDRLFNHMAFIKAKAHWIIPHSVGGRWECDDYSSTSGFARSAGDFWRIFVR